MTKKEITKKKPTEREEYFVEGLYYDFEIAFNGSMLPASEIRKNLEKRYFSYLGNLFWILLSDLEWQVGELEPEVFEKALDTIDNVIKKAQGKDIREDSKDYKIITNYKDLSHRLCTKNSEPRHRIPLKKSKPVFEKSDCVIFKYSDSKYGAFYVADSHLDEKDSRLCSNAIIILNIYQEEMPKLSQFYSASVCNIPSERAKNKNKLYWIQADEFNQAIGADEYFKTIGKLKSNLVYKFGKFYTWQLCKDNSLETIKNNIKCSDTLRSILNPQKLIVEAAIFVFIVFVIIFALVMWLVLWLLNLLS